MGMWIIQNLLIRMQMNYSTSFYTDAELEFVRLIMVVTKISFLCFIKNEDIDYFIYFNDVYAWE